MDQKLIFFCWFLEITSITTPVITNPKSGNYALDIIHILIKCQYERIVG